MKVKALMDSLLKLDGDSEVLISVGSGTDDVFEISEILKEQGRIFLTGVEEDYEDYTKLLSKKEKILIKREYCYNCKEETDWQLAYSNPADLCCSQCGIYDWHNAELGRRKQEKREELECI